MLRKQKKKITLTRYSLRIGKLRGVDLFGDSTEKLTELRTATDPHRNVRSSILYCFC